MIASLLLAALGTSSPQVSAPGTSFEPGPLPIENPLKGYAAYLDGAPKLSGYASMAYVEAPWSDLEPEEGQYRFDRLDARFEHPLSKDKSVVLRIWLDYPSRPSGVPGWLRAKGLKMTPYSEYGGGLSPDYDNDELKRGLFRFIAALGRRYADSGRVRFIEVGFLGFWGEFHTYPHDQWFASSATQSLVVDALHRAFPHTHLLGRNPAYASLNQPWMGFHDDMIPDDTDSGEVWDFLPELTAHGLQNNWKVAPTGGEMVPFAAKRLLSTDWDKLTSAVRKCHFSFIAGYCPVLEQNVSPEFKRRSDELASLLGYSFRLQRALLPAATSASSSWRFEISGSNVGVAPFYYPWPVNLALLRPGGGVVDQQPLNVDVRSWLPGGFTMAGSVRWHAPAGSYDVAIGILDPASKRPVIRFANQLEYTNGWTILKRGVRLDP